MKWVLVAARVVLGLLFLAAAGMKLAGTPAMVKEFGEIGLGQGFRYLTAAIEVAAALLLIRPGTATIGAALIVCVCIGAFAAQLLVLHGDLIHCVVLGAVAASVAWSYRGARNGAVA